MRDLAIGIDIGTTGIKIMVMGKDGILFQDERPHDLISQKAGFAEENAQRWWEDLKSLLMGLRDGFGKRIGSIGVTGMVPALVLLDDDLNVIRNAILQNDSRSTEEIESLKEMIKGEEFFELTANTINQQIIFPKIMWIRKNEPQSFEKTRWIMGSYDFIATKLTGVPHVELNWALESGMLLVKEKRWYTELLKELDIDEKILPPIFDPTQIIGKVSKEVSKETGLPDGIPVIAGSADHIAASLAVGLVEEGDLLLKIGGAGDIMFVTDSFKTEKRLFFDYHDIPGKYVLNGCMATSGSLIKWYMNLLKTDDYDELTKLAEMSSIGSEGIVTLPYFLGEKTPIFDTKARGLIFGLDLHHSRGDIFRSLLESVSFGFNHHIEILKEAGFKIKRVFISDGGAKNPLWRQIVSDIIGMDLNYKKEKGSVFGVSLLAAYSAGIIKNLYDFEKDEESEITHFNLQNHLKYEKYYTIYKKLYMSLRPIYEELYNLREVKEDEI
ncbi:FGGY-family carbohydrate kinase [Athalassotoga saccharophila]|uniref:FGGY-family carbohydrate kinase n=1 Tax=Athalassotoga saccharophila TaxID=1441386 RepID=UPI00137B2510|nr:FGGY-family carbohydrate kinase [Athalassotoga saccharophila]BBJ27526.1 xylulose kinase [Athalassotoga saccharophila]